MSAPPDRPLTRRELREAAAQRAAELRPAEEAAAPAADGAEHAEPETPPDEAVPDDGAPVAIDAAYAGQASITTLGTVGTGTWQANAVGVAYGGTGATTQAGARTNLGLGDMATQASSGGDPAEIAAAAAQAGYDVGPVRPAMDMLAGQARN